MECCWIAFEQGSDGPYVFKNLQLGEAQQQKCGHIQHIPATEDKYPKIPFVAIFGRLWFF